MDKLIIEIALRNLYQAGKIPCIKFVRELTQMGLKEAKDYVENWMRSHTLFFPPSDINLHYENSVLKKQNEKLNTELAEIKARLTYIIEGR